MEREKLASRLGFIMLSAACAIGIGNVWKFPYLVGQYGGGAFVLVYLFFLIVLGIPVMTMEFSVGRGAQRSPVRMYQQLEKPGSKWHLHGLACLIGCVLLMMFYTTVAGWMLLYFYKMLTGQFAGLGTEAVGAVFSAMLANPGEQLIAMLIVVIAGFLICARGLQNSLEKVTNVMMLLLLVIMVLLAVNSMFLSGGAEGLRFYLLPDFGRMREVGIAEVFVAAMNQAFFTLSLGVGALAIFGSYIDREHALLGEAVNVAALDTFVAFVSGLIIFPACFAYGVEPGAGPGLIFITLPNIFIHMPMGRLWGSLFFVFMSFAAFSTVLAVFENIMACVMDLTGWTRAKTGIICAVCMIVLSLPCLLGFNVLSAVQPMGEGSGIMDLEDFVLSNLMLPLGSLVFVLFCTQRSGWGWDGFTAEANTGHGLQLSDWMRPYLTYVLPLVVLAILLLGLV